MEIVGVDPRDQRWECYSPRYRVYFYEGTAADEYEVRGANDVHAVIKWAENDSAGRPYVLYACADQDGLGLGLGLLRLAGRDPNDVPDPSIVVTAVWCDSDSEDGRPPRS